MLLWGSLFLSSADIITVLRCKVDYLQIPARTTKVIQSGGSPSGTFSILQFYTITLWISAFSRKDVRVGRNSKRDALTPCTINYYVSASLLPPLIYNFRHFEPRPPLAL